MEKQAIELVHDAKNVVKELVASKPPSTDDSNAPMFERRAPRRPKQPPKHQSPKPYADD